MQTITYPHVDVSPEHEFILKEGLPPSLDTPLPQGFEAPLLNRPDRAKNVLFALGRRPARAFRPVGRLSADLGLRGLDAQLDEKSHGHPPLGAPLLPPGPPRPLADPHTTSSWHTPTAG